MSEGTRWFSNPSRPWSPTDPSSGQWEQLIASMRDLRFRWQDAACKLSYLDKEMDRVLTTQEILAMARRADRETLVRKTTNGGYSPKEQ